MVLTWVEVRQAGSRGKGMDWALVLVLGLGDGSLDVLGCY